MTKYEKRIEGLKGFGALLLSGLILTGLAMLITYPSHSMSKHIGEELVVNGDTLTIVNSSSIFGEYTLSNGRYISTDFYNK